MKKLLLITGILLCLSLSCEQHETLVTILVNKNQIQRKDQRTISIEEAKQYYNNSIVVSNSSFRIAIGNKTEREVDWVYAKKVTQENGLEVIVTPIVYKTKKRPGVLLWNDATVAAEKLPTKENMFEAQESYLTFKDKNGAVQSQIVQFLSSKEYRKKNKEKIFKKDFTGWIIAITWDEKLIAGFEFENGRDVRKLLVSTSTSRLSSCEYIYHQNVTASCSPCGSNCTSCDVFISGGYRGTCTGPSSDSGTDNNYNIVYGGSSGGGGEYSYLSQTNNWTQSDIIVDPNLSPCLSSVLWHLSKSYIDSYLGNQFRTIYGDNGGTRNINFTAGTVSGDGVANYDYLANTIFLDQSKVGAASNEFVASVIAHEIAHVIITEYQTTGIVPPNQYAQHMNIFEGMVLNISYMLSNAYPSLSANDRKNAIALALGGIADVVQSKNGNIHPQMNEMAVTKYNISLAEASAIIQLYKDGTLGTHCNPN